MLTVKNIVKTFHGKKILDDVSFDVHPGQIIVLLGQSGVGKSTMLRVLSNLETIDAGCLQLDSAPIDFSKVGMVFQDFNLFPHLTVLQNVTLPLVHVAKKTEEDAKHLARVMLDRFNVLAKADTYPIALSGGQKQRVALARALCMNPEVLCLDEPTSALDPMLTVEVASIISQLATAPATQESKKIMTIIATHDIGLIENLSCTIHLMQDGKIIETATSEQIHNNAESFEKIKNFMKGKKAS